MDLFPGVDPYAGAHIAGYKLEALVGRGGMSLVYRAQHEHLDRKVALKLLAPELSQDERFRKRFVTESRLAASLEHPNIIPIYDAGEAEGLLYIAMRFVEGCTLAQWLDRHGPLPSSVTLYVVGQIADALDVAHSAGLIHRDVKPENILVTENQAGLDLVFLSDFGLTKRPNMASTTKSGELMGTVGYVAPEQIEGKPLDGRSDVYSLGCVLYQCLTGCRPFDLENDVAVLWAHLNEPVPHITDGRPELPKAMNEVVIKALAKTPEQRYATAGALATAARGALGTEVPARSQSVGRTQPARRRFLSLAALVGIAVVGIILLVVRQMATPSSDSANPSETLDARRSPGAKGLSGESLPTAAALNRVQGASSYLNPLVTSNAPDPTVIPAGGLFYAYTTQTSYGPDLIHTPILVSRDLIAWNFFGDALKDLPKWAATSTHSDTWAPDIVRIDGHYNLYFAERLEATGSMGIAVATSDSPQGPFHVLGDPLMKARGYVDIDPFVFQDPDGRLLMYWGSNGAPIRVQRLSEDGTRRVGVTRPVLFPSTATSYDNLVEGPALVYHEGFYFLFYSGNRCCGDKAHYAVLVARSRSPLGPFERAPTNPIVAANAHFAAPGHGTIFRDDSGAYFILYHAMLATDPTHLRGLMLDRIRWQGGWPVVNGGDGPTHSRQPRPKVGA